MAEEKDVRIISWPEDPVALEHSFNLEEPCPVSITFADAPAKVVVSTDPQQKLNVNMAMDVNADKPIPVCLSVCEPICLDSDYTVGISIFDNPVSTIRVRGRSKLFNCRDNVQTKLVCVDFTNGVKPGIEYKESYKHENLTFIPLGDMIRTSTIGEPSEQVKLAFPREGVRVEFPSPVDDVQLTVNNYSGPTLDFYVYVGGTLENRYTETIQNMVKKINLAEENVTAVEIKGGDNEASIIEVCYRA